MVSLVYWAGPGYRNFLNFSFERTAAGSLTLLASFMNGWQELALFCAERDISMLPPSLLRMPHCWEDISVLEQ